MQDVQLVKKGCARTSLTYEGKRWQIPKQYLYGVKHGVTYCLLLLSDGAKNTTQRADGLAPQGGAPVRNR